MIYYNMYSAMEFGGWYNNVTLVIRIDSLRDLLLIPSILAAENRDKCWPQWQERHPFLLRNPLEGMPPAFSNQWQCMTRFN